MVILGVCCVRRHQIHFDTAIQGGAAIQIDIDGNAFGYIVNEIHTLFAKIGGHGNVDIIAGIVIMQVQPVVVLVGFLVQNTVDHKTGIGLSLSFFGIFIGISIFCGDLRSPVVHYGSILAAACQNHNRQNHQQEQALQGYLLHFFHSALLIYLKFGLQKYQPLLFPPVLPQ